jgi:ABC-2 type transport system permease protein
MRKILKLAASDYKRRWNKPALILLYVFTPVIITLIMWMAFGGGSSSSGFAPLKLAIVNNDKGGILSDFFVNAFSNENAKDKIKAFVVSEAEATKLINGRKVSGVMIIPKNFSKDILGMKKTEIKLIKNPTEMIYPMIAETGLNIVKDGTNYLLTIFEDEITIIRTAIEKKEKMDNSVFTNLYDKIGDKIKKIIPLFEERKIEIKDIKEEKKKIPMAVFYFTGMAFFFLFFISNAVLNDMVKERNSFIIKRLFLSELKKSEYYFARLLSAFLFMFTIEIVLAITGRFLFQIKTDSIFLLLVILLLSAIILSLLSAVIIGLSNNERQVHNIGMIFVFLFAMLGGSLIPVSILPAAIRKFSVISPLYYITESVISLVLQRMDKFFHLLTITFFIAMGLFILSYLLNIRVLKKVVK